MSRSATTRQAIIEELAESGPSGPVAHWGLGPKKDAPKPAARTPSDRRRAYRERHPVQKRIIDRLWNARRRGTTPTPASWIDGLKVSA